MNDWISTVLLWLFVVNLGIAFGAGVYEHRIVVPQWFPAGGRAGVNSTAMREADTGRRFWAFVTTGPLTLLTLASLFFATRAPEPVRTWWLATAVVVLCERVFTFAFFIPTAVRLMRSPVSSQPEPAAIRWARLNHVRSLLTLVGWMTALRALMLS